ncbi:MAG: aminotransferase class IV [Trueperaceae bacterium]|nr:aminotransferase class IV [Trueperaceae bacterium]
MITGTNSYGGTHDALPDDRNKDVLIYVNGDLVPRNEAKVSVFDSGFLVGDGVWEGIRLQGGALVFLEQHLKRLYEGAKAIALDIGLTPEQLTSELRRVIDANRMEDGVHVRLMITRGTKRTPSQDPRFSIGGPTIVIIAEHKKSNPHVTAAGIKLFTSTVRRPTPDVLDPKLNCHSKLHEVIALHQAQLAGADEALMLDPHGAVATCNATNFFVVRAGEVWTSTGQYCMNGITRGMVIRLCKENGIPIFERDFSLTDVYGADEAFVTGTFGGLTPATLIDGRTIGSGTPGPMTARLSELYAESKVRYVGQQREEVSAGAARADR